MAAVFFSTIWLFLISGMSPAPGKGTLVIEVTALEAPCGEVHIAVYDREENFMDTRRSIAERVIPVRGGEAVQAQLPELAFGVYALAVYQDCNKNGILDTNALGIPKEPYAFSNNISVKWRRPSFREARFELEQPQQLVSIRLKRWEEH